jgi:hypothetical protein
MLPKNYTSTENKERVREEDAELIKKEFLRKKRKLLYLGMPSGEMRDILAWQSYIDKCTAVEIDPQQRSELVLNAIKNNLQDKIKVIFGDIEEILIKGKDKFNNKLEFPYDVVFLDCFGTLLYKELKRIKAITSLIEKQKGLPFLFLITFNLKERKYCKHSVLSVLNKIQKELCSFYIRDDSTKKRIRDVMEWYKLDKTNEMYRQKLFVPYFIKTTAEEYGFRIHAYAPIFYLGFNNNPMIHFAFKMIPEMDSPTKAISEQTVIDLINLHIREASRKRLFVRKEQAPPLSI